MGTPGSASGLGKRARSNPGTAPQADSTGQDWIVRRVVHLPDAILPPRRLAKAIPHKVADQTRD